MGETVEDTAAVSKAKPTISVPPRGSVEALYINWSGPGFSPGPITQVSSFFSEQGPFSFSQLLAGAMASPVMAKRESLLRSDSELKERKGNFSKDGINSESGSRYKQNRPMDLVVAQPQPQLEPQSLSPLFMFPSGLSPSGLLNSPGFLSPIQSPFGMSHRQALAHVTAQAAFSQSYMQMQGLRRSLTTATSEPLAHHSVSAPSKTLTEQTNILPTVLENSKIESSEVSQSDGKPTCVASDKPASDGYNWRKYGQKHVKANECPRSYYKCTHLNCPVKKTVERSLDGHISDITYKGQHNHNKPQPSKRGKDSCALDRTMNSRVKLVFASQSQTEKKGLAEATAVNSEPLNFQATTQQPFENHDATTHNVEMKDTAMDGVDRNDEPIAKRRIMDIGSSMPVSSQQTVTDSKIGLQTRSEVDLLDDGFKWRKYGQKLVKGNPHPRSYYRCTYSGCDVRKHVERASADPKTVITTYEGKHNHEIPVERYTSHGSASLQQLKTQKMSAQNPKLSKQMDFGNKDQISMTLQLKKEQIAAA